MLNILLDADETILDFPRSSEESFRFAMQAAGIPAAGGAFEEFKAINDSLWKEYERGEITKSRLVVERFVRFFARKGIQADAAAVNKLYFDKLCGMGYLLAGAREFLDALKERGKVYLITNGTPPAQYGRLDSLGIRSMFDGIFVSDEIGAAKPSRAFFDHVLASVGCRPEECIVIGDSLSSDIAGAVGAGIPCIWYAPSGAGASGMKPDHIARSYAEVLHFVDISE